MALTIGTNVASLQASAAASSVNRDLETSLARLSTGKRINSAADDAAGVAIASRLSSEIRGTDQAIRNALDGQALITKDEVIVLEEDVDERHSLVHELAGKAEEEKWSLMSDCYKQCQTLHLGPLHRLSDRPWHAESQRQPRHRHRRCQLFG